MDETPAIEISADCNRDLVLGQLVQAVNTLTKSNAADHAKIFARLEEGDQYFMAFKVSRCAFGWLNRNGILKLTVAGTIFTAFGWIISRILT